MVFGQIIFISNILNILNGLPECIDPLNLKKEINPSFVVGDTVDLTKAPMSPTHYALEFTLENIYNFYAKVDLSFSLVRSSRAIAVHVSNVYEVESVKIKLGDLEDSTDSCIDEEMELLFVKNDRFSDILNVQKLFILSIAYRGQTLTYGNGIILTSDNNPVVFVSPDHEKMRNRDSFPCIDEVTSLASYTIIAHCPTEYKAVSPFLKDNNPDLSLKISPVLLALLFVPQNINKQQIKMPNNRILGVYDTNQILSKIDFSSDFAVGGEILDGVEFDFDVVLIKGINQMSIPFHKILVLVLYESFPDNKLDYTMFLKGILETNYIYRTNDGLLSHSLRNGVVNILMMHYEKRFQSQETRRAELSKRFRRDKNRKQFCQLMNTMILRGQILNDHLIYVVSFLKDILDSNNYKQFLKFLSSEKLRYGSDESIYVFLNKIKPNLGTFIELLHDKKYLPLLEINVDAFPTTQKVKARRFCLDDTSLEQSFKSPINNGAEILWVDVDTEVKTNTYNYWNNNNLSPYQILDYKNMNVTTYNEFKDAVINYSERSYMYLDNAFKMAKKQRTRYNIDVLLLVIKELRPIKDDHELNSLMIDILEFLDSTTKDMSIYTNIIKPYVIKYFGGLNDVISPEYRNFQNSFYIKFLKFKFDQSEVQNLLDILPYQTCSRAINLDYDPTSSTEDRMNLLRICCSLYRSTISISPATDFSEENYRKYIAEMVCTSDRPKFLELMRLLSREDFLDSFRMSVYHVLMFNNEHLDDMLKYSLENLNFILQIYRSYNIKENLEETLCLVASRLKMRISIQTLETMLVKTGYDCARLLISEHPVDSSFRSSITSNPEIFRRWSV